jgi:hypothetical protein
MAAEDAMEIALSRVLVRTILEHAQDYPWVLQEIGLLGLRLDEVREYRLHVWDPTCSVDEPPVHDHPFDFTSTIVAGEMTNTLYTETPSGVEYSRIRYPPNDEDARRADPDTVRLSATATTYGEGGQYSQRASELHDSRQAPGTVTVIRRCFVDVAELTVCRLDASNWVSGRSRPARPEEVKRMVAKALEWF